MRRQDSTRQDPTPRGIRSPACVRRGWVEPNARENEWLRICGERGGLPSPSGGPVCGAAVLALPVEYVVARHRHRVDGFGELHLENHVILPPERNFRTDEVHLP